MTDLSKLRPEIACAVEWMDGGLGDDDHVWRVIRAELLRLADESRALAVNLDESNADRAKACANESAWKLRAEVAERERDELCAKLAEAQEPHIKRAEALRCVTHHHACDCREAEFAEIKRERDEWRRKVVEAPAINVANDAALLRAARLPDDWAGKRVAFVVLEDGK